MFFVNILNHINLEEQKHEITTDIKITPHEQQIFDTLLEVAKINNLDTIIRVSGGWVRDKMLHKDSKDIDFALDNMKGVEFAEMICAHLYPGEGKKYGKISANSEKSKHLETATLKVHDTFIDLVNLRSEEYTEDSRVPTMKFGTPLQDAERRDLTINAMFYNINKKEIEDFTGYGVNDLTQGIIRTPLEPLQTFLDDPLRVLRIIRFATRYNFKILEEIDAAIQDPKIKESLATKVTYERIGRETDLMLGGVNPSGAIEYFYKYKIFSHILKFPESCEELQDENKVNDLTFVSVRICQILHKIFDKSSNQNINQLGVFYCGILLPFKDYDFTIIKKNKKTHTDKAYNYVMIESLKQPNKLKDFVHTCFSNLDELIYHANSTEFDIIKVGTLVRNIGESLTEAFMLAMAKQHFDEHLVDGSEINNENIEYYSAKYSEFYNTIKEHKLHEAYKLKPLLNGKGLMKLYEIKGGPILKKLTEEVLKWQFLNPDANLEELEKYMIDNKDQFLS